MLRSPDVGDVLAVGLFVYPCRGGKADPEFCSRVRAGEYPRQHHLARAHRFERGAGLVSGSRRHQGFYGATADEARRYDARDRLGRDFPRSEEHTSELQSLMRISYAVFCLKKKKYKKTKKMYQTRNK